MESETYVQSWNLCNLLILIQAKAVQEQGHCPPATKIIQILKVTLFDPIFIIREHSHYDEDIKYMNKKRDLKRIHPGNKYNNMKHLK